MVSSVLAGLSIMVVGASHLVYPEHLLSSLHNGLIAQGASVYSIGICGATPADWLGTKPGDCGAERRGKNPAVPMAKAQTMPITDLIAREKPDLIVVVMGDSLASYSQSAFPKNWAWQTTTQFVKAIANTGTSCIWVGPPWGSEGGGYNKTYARVRQVSSFLASNVAPCTYIDSLKFAKPGEWPSIDGTHLKNSSYQAWGKAITESVIQIEKSHAPSNSKNREKP